MRVMRILDRYIIRNFLGTFFLMVALFCVVAVVFDVAENLERLIKNGAPWSEVFGSYYVNFCLALGNMLSAFIVFLTILLFTSRLAQRSEIIAVLAGGISFQRLMRPYFMASTILVVGSLLLAHVVLPSSNGRKMDFEVEYVHKEFHIAEQHLYREIQPGTIVYFRSVNAGRAVGYRFVMEQWQGEVLQEKWTASKAKWIPKRRRGAFPICAGGLGMKKGRSNSTSSPCSIPLSICLLMTSGSARRPCPRWVGMPSMKPLSAKKPRVQVENAFCSWRPIPAPPMPLPSTSWR